ncbi:MAG: hypothetical protein V3U71_11800 [Cocleimonas sp.]
MEQAIERPAGVIVIALYNIFGGLTISLMFSVVFLLGNLMLTISAEFSLLVFLFFLLVFTLAIMMFAAAYGLWTFKAWGWHLNFWLYLIAIPLMIGFLIFDPDSRKLEAAFSIGISLIASIAIVYYLRKDQIKRLYIRKTVYG